MTHVSIMVGSGQVLPWKCILRSKKNMLCSSFFQTNTPIGESYFAAIFWWDHRVKWSWSMFSLEAWCWAHLWTSWPLHQLALRIWHMDKSGKNALSALENLGYMRHGNCTVKTWILNCWTVIIRWCLFWLDGSIVWQQGLYDECRSLRWIWRWVWGASYRCWFPLNQRWCRGKPTAPCPAVFCQWGKDGATSGTTRGRSLRHTTYKKHFEGKEHFVLARSGKVFQTFSLHIQICWWSPFWFLLL